ncbi:MAG: YaeQ family protein [Sorangiineae bacterium]|nr:YaeQ family protein [Polyangiaceae bacterium]MEB2324184.1 YaeQ family protein [Sorangiineae bacterium]
MAAGSTIHRFQITLSDVDRGIYEALDLRVARHPSESARYLVTRVLAYCLVYEPGLTFTKGLSTTDEPAIWLHDADGLLALTVEIGTPSAERLHKASKASRRVVVFTHRDLESALRVARARPVHRAHELELFAFEPALLDALEARLERNATFELTRSEDRLYLTLDGETLDGALLRAPLAAPS